MTSRPWNASWIAGALALLIVPVLGAPTGLQAQDAAEVAAPEFTEEQMEALTRAHVQIEEIRDQLHQDMAQWHEDHRREEVREDADEAIAAVFEEHGVTAEDYELFKFAISVDPEHRDSFERIRDELDDN